jgi:predicted nuclease of predicted toxin-antitoxin system
MAGRRRRSKKPFGASSGRPPEPTLFLDECLGRLAVPEALRAAGATVVCHHELFTTGTDDQEWLAALAAHPDWIVLTKDSRIRHRKLEFRALATAGLRVFVLTSANLSGAEQGDAFVRALRRIRRLGVRPGPFIARVTRFGSVQVLEP